jgi:hypothetical protein
LIGSTFRADTFSFKQEAKQSKQAMPDNRREAAKRQEPEARRTESRDPGLTALPSISLPTRTDDLGVMKRKEDYSKFTTRTSR